MIITLNSNVNNLQLGEAQLRTELAECCLGHLAIAAVANRRADVMAGAICVVDL